MVAARMMVPLRGDLATRLAPQRFWFGMEVVARCLYWLSWLWHTKDGKLMVKLSGQRSVAGNGASPARCVRSKFPPPNLKKPVQARAAWQIWLRWCHSAVQRT